MFVTEITKCVDDVLNLLFVSAEERVFPFHYRLLPKYHYKMIKNLLQLSTKKHLRFILVANHDEWELGVLRKKESITKVNRYKIVTIV